MTAKSPERLRTYSNDLQYEIWMMQETAQRLLHSDALHIDAVLKDAVVESCLVHARSLGSFIYPPDDKRDDDVTSDDYATDPPTWTRARGTKPPILKTLSFRTGKEIAYLTTKRLDDDDPAKRWPLIEIVEALYVLLKKFVDHAATHRLDPLVTQFIKGLQPPMASTAIRHYNPGSTELLTAKTPLGFPIDLGTVAPIKPRESRSQ